MDFGTRPPEINSARMHSGPGSDLMMTAATAWDALADDLRAAAAAARTAGRAATSHREWLHTLGAQALRAGEQARAAARAYEAAFAATVPPPLIDANRAHRVSLAAKNFLGQAAADIADVEADYERMWAHDTETMYSYASASAKAAALEPFPLPPVPDEGYSEASGNWRADAAPQVVAAGRLVLSAIPPALRGLAASPLNTFDGPLLPITASLSQLSSLSAPLDFSIKHLNSLNKAAALRRMLPVPGDADGTTVVAGVGRGAPVGMLTAPPAWANAMSTAGDAERPLPRGRVSEPIRLIAENGTPRRPSRGRTS